MFEQGLLEVLQLAEYADGLCLFDGGGVVKSRVSSLCIVLVFLGGRFG